MDNFSYQKSLMTQTLETYWFYLLAIFVAFSIYLYSPKKGIKNLFKGGSG